MNLREFAAKKPKGSLYALAKRAGMSPARLTAMVRYGFVPKVETARRIAAASDGEITVAGLLGLTPEELQP